MWSMISQSTLAFSVGAVFCLYFLKIWQLKTTTLGLKFEFLGPDTSPKSPTKFSSRNHSNSRLTGNKLLFHVISWNCARLLRQGGKTKTCFLVFNSAIDWRRSNNAIFRNTIQLQNQQLGHPSLWRKWSRFDLVSNSGHWKSQENSSPENKKSAPEFENENPCFETKVSYHFWSLSPQTRL